MFNSYVKLPEGKWPYLSIAIGLNHQRRSMAVFKSLLADDYVRLFSDMLRNITTYGKSSQLDGPPMVLNTAYKIGHLYPFVIYLQLFFASLIRETDKPLQKLGCSHHLMSWGKTWKGQVHPVVNQQKSMGAVFPWEGHINWCRQWDIDQVTIEVAVVQWTACTADTGEFFFPFSGQRNRDG